MTVGPLTLENTVFLAPMSGVSDLPFRQIAMEFGAGAVVSEMIASEQLVREEDEALLKLRGQDLSPNIVQLAGREAKWMALAAKAACDAGAEIIDINMGCPAKKVTSGYSGSALMRDLDHALTLIEATVKAADCPVTLKTRLGWDHESLNAGELIRRAEDAGIQMVTIHGRTRCQFYKGQADWSAIAALRANTKLPFVANGDVCSLDEAALIKEQTKADAVMIGRGAYGQPWLPGHAQHFLRTGERLTAPMGEALASLIVCHYEALLAHYGDHIGMRAARKHLGWYLDARRGLAAITKKQERLSLLTENDPTVVVETIRDVFSREFHDNDPVFEGEAA